MTFEAGLRPEQREYCEVRTGVRANISTLETVSSIYHLGWVCQATYALDLNASPAETSCVSSPPIYRTEHRNALTGTSLNYQLSCQSSVLVQGDQNEQSAARYFPRRGRIARAARLSDFGDHELLV